MLPGAREGAGGDGEMREHRGSIDPAAGRDERSNESQPSSPNQKILESVALVRPHRKSVEKSHTRARSLERSSSSCQSRRTAALGKMDASQESLNSVDSLSDDSCPRSVVSTLATSYASPSILLNPLPPSNKARKTQLVSHHASPPPASFKGLYSSSAPNPPPLDRTASANSSIVSSALTTGAESIAYSQHSAGGRPLCRADTQSTAGSVITFAPLPPGRSRYRSNSLTIGVAARAQMIASQGGGSHMARPRYAGSSRLPHTLRHPSRC